MISKPNCDRFKSHTAKCRTLILAVEMILRQLTKSKSTMMKVKMKNEVRRISLKTNSGFSPRQRRYYSAVLSSSSTLCLSLFGLLMCMCAYILQEKDSDLHDRNYAGGEKSSSTRSQDGKFFPLK